MASILPDLWSRLFSAELERAQRAKYNNNNKKAQLIASARTIIIRNNKVSIKELYISRVFFENFICFRQTSLQYTSLYNKEKEMEICACVLI